MNDRLRQIITEDSEGIFQAQILDQNTDPEVNFQDIAIAWLDGKSWEIIVAEFGLPSKRRVKNFYHQSLKRFRSYLRQRLEE